MIEEKGSISISTEDIFPIIKKWLYSEKDIFVRELVSNCSDAISKFKGLCGIGEAELAEGETFAVTVHADKEAGTLSFEDNGIGMTGDEVKKYINQIAFSGARDFLEKYKDSAEGAQIIGHFGLGFYSAFMVSEKVTIDTLSWQEGAEAVYWESDGSSGYEMAESDRTTRGTRVTLFLNDDGKEYLDRYVIRSVLDKYFRFLPYPLTLTCSDDKEGMEKRPINEKEPLWIKKPQDVTEDEYKEFYHSVFADMTDPLFWIHLNIDYPFRLQGILYFPKLRDEMGNLEGEVKLYCNRVFVADNIKEVIPDYLLLLKGCIDCPDLPLNVSRSFLQNDGTVKKLQSHIVKKVSDKLTSLFSTERESYEKYWDDIHPFVKFGCVRDESFYEKVEKAILFKTAGGKTVTLEEYLESCPSEGEDEKAKKLVYYASDPASQSAYVDYLRSCDVDPVILDHVIDNAFISFLEYKRQDVSFKRADSDLTGVAGGQEENETLASLIHELDPGLEVRTSDLKEDGPAALILLPEEERRMRDMMKQWGSSAAAMPEEKKTFLFNSSHPLVKKLGSLEDDGTKKLIAAELYDMALLGFRRLEADELSRFLARTAEIMEKL